jgi:aminomethyltransferase
MISNQLKRSPLHQRHLALGAKITEFAGWEMPLSYTSLVEEHYAVRAKAGLFDLSHMGEIEVSGKKALDLLNRLTVNDVSKLAQGQVQYNLLCQTDGGVIDDLTIYRTGEEEYLLCVNAANTAKDFEWLVSHQREGVTLTDKSSHYCLLAVQGPWAQICLQKVWPEDTAWPNYYWFSPVPWEKEEALLSRTGYTGEDGFEIYLRGESGLRLWDRLLELTDQLGLKPAGLGARDTLRTEMKYALYGQDLSETTTPLEAGLSWLIKWDKGDFIGKEALLEQKQQGIKRKLVGFQMLGPAIPRPGGNIFYQGQLLGQTTSGTYSPSLKKGIGLGYIKKEFAKVGQLIELEIRGKLRQAKLVPTPFYRQGSLVKVAG